MVPKVDIGNGGPIIVQKFDIVYRRLILVSKVDNSTEV